jgi:transposase-like protein
VNEQPEIKHWTGKRKAALVKKIIRSQITIYEATRQHDLTAAEVEQWVDEAGMENAFRTSVRRCFAY